MTCLALRADPQYSAPDPYYDEIKSRFLVTRAQEMMKQQDLSYAEALYLAEKEWNGPNAGTTG